MTIAQKRNKSEDATLDQQMFLAIANKFDPPPEEKEEDVVLWKPNPPKPDGTPNPQQVALDIDCHEIFYGGQAGGGKSDLLLGSALTRHRKSIIFRREFAQLKDLIERSKTVIEGNGRFNENKHLWRDLPDGRTLEFGGVKQEDDVGKYKGRPHDLKAFDEITEFTKFQYQFLCGWARTTDSDQPVQIICTGNPPTDEDGVWVLEHWGPWLDPEHENPAESGEIRWFASVDGEEKEVDGPKPFLHDGELVRPTSRTFIRATLDDNPHLADSEYRSVLQRLPEPLRSQLLYGDFTAAADPDPFQVIPLDWVRLAQKRWREMERPIVPVDGVGIDCARGGPDYTCFAFRYGAWFDEVVTYKGKDTPDGPTVAALLNHAHQQRGLSLKRSQQHWYINLDVIGIGSSVFDSVSPVYRYVTPVNVASGSRYRDKTGKYAMVNIRAEMHWRMREALDPDHGDDIALPPGNDIVRDLCAARFKLTTRGILVEPKEEIRKRLGRSPNKGEALMLALLPSYARGFWAKGPSR